MDLAEKLSQKPLKKTKVWTLLSRCEEVGCYGADAFAADHKAELKHPAWLSIGSVGGSRCSLSNQ